jgi:hypothetical protein
MITYYLSINENMKTLTNRLESIAALIRKYQIEPLIYTKRIGPRLETTSIQKTERVGAD